MAGCDELCVVTKMNAWKIVRCVCADKKVGNV